MGFFNFLRSSGPSPGSSTSSARWWHQDPVLWVQGPCQLGTRCFKTPTHSVRGPRHYKVGLGGINDILWGHCNSMLTSMTISSTVAPLIDCTSKTTTRFLFDNVVTQFGCPRILMSNQGGHFVYRMISVMTEKFQIQRNNITPYHPQVNRIVEEFNKALVHALTKVSNANQDDWDLKISLILWDYKMT